MIRKVIREFEAQKKKFQIKIIYRWFKIFVWLVKCFVLQLCNRTKISDVVGEQKSGSGQGSGLLFRFGSDSGIKISGTSPSGFGVFEGF